MLLLTLVFSYRKSHWFYIEPGQHNTYKIVQKVLVYARNHKYPCMTQRSAFTYHDGERLTRIDFAKERYSGPFLTEEVEDVKDPCCSTGSRSSLHSQSSYVMLNFSIIHTSYWIGSKFEN